MKIALVLLSFFVFATPVLAQQQTFNLGVTPATSYLWLKPGSKTQHTITLENKADTAIEVTPKLVDFEADGTTGQPILHTASSFEYLDRSSFEGTVLTIPAKKRAQLTLVFSVPASAPEREYPLTLLFESVATTPNRLTSTSSLVGIVGSNLIVLVSKDPQPTQLINIQTAGAPFFVDSFKPLTLGPIVKNNNFAAATMAGTITITDMFGNQVAEFSIFPDSVLGFSSRELRGMKETFDPQKEPEVAPLTYAPKFLAGPYTITTTITQPYLSETETQIVATTSHTVVAIPFALIAFIGAISIGAIAFLVHKKRKPISF